MVKKPLELGHIDKIISDIKDYIQEYGSSDFHKIQEYINWNLELLESEAKRALQEAMSISDEMLQYIDTPSDVVYDSNIGINESDDDYLLTRSICDALDIILTIKCYHYVRDIECSDDVKSLIESLDELRTRMFIYRGVELEKQQIDDKYKKSKGGSKNKKPLAICALIGDFVRNDIDIKPRQVWARILRLINEGDGRLVISLKGVKYCIYKEKDDVDILCELADGKIEPKTMRFRSAFEDHVTAAKKFFRKKFLNK